MPDDFPRDRRYNEQEVSLILQKAAELQMRTHERADGPSSGGMSLAELESIATEAGLNVEHVRHAATQLAVRPTAAGGRSPAGARRRITVEREVRGELPASAHDLVADAIRRHTGSARDGIVTVAGRSLLWTLERWSGRTTISVSTRPGRTLVHVDRSLLDYAVTLYMTVGVGGTTTAAAGALALALGTAMSAAAATGVGALVVGGTYLVGRGMFRRKVSAAEYEAHALADVVAASIAEAIDVGE